MTLFFIHYLVILAAWTLVIKFIFPISYAILEEVSWSTYVMWDFWWVAHLWLAWAFLVQWRYLYPVAYIISVLEVLIISFKFYFFLGNPDWTIWTTNWFINKVFVLSCFLLIFGYLVMGIKRWRVNSISSK